MEGVAAKSYHVRLRAEADGLENARLGAAGFGICSGS